MQIDIIKLSHVRDSTKQGYFVLSKWIFQTVFSSIPDLFFLFLFDITITETFFMGASNSMGTEMSLVNYETFS